MTCDTPRIVQPGQRSWLTLLLWLLSVVAVALVVGWASYRPPQPQPVAAKVDVGAFQRQIQELQRQLSVLEREKAGLREQNVALERSSQIDREATLQAREQLKEYQRERLELKEELAFLSGIVSNGVKRADGLYVQGFQLLKGSEEGVFLYHFTVSQSLKNPDQALGWIYLELEAESGGEMVSLPLQEITRDKQEKLKMRFRHFQDVQGVLVLPEAVVPASLVVKIKPTTKSLSEIEKRFDWLVSEG